MTIFLAWIYGELLNQESAELLLAKTGFAFEEGGYFSGEKKYPYPIISFGYSSFYFLFSLNSLFYIHPFT